MIMFWIVAVLAVAAAMASCADANPARFNTESYDYARSAVTAASAHRYRVIVLQATDGDKWADPAQT